MSLKCQFFIDIFFTNGALKTHIESVHEENNPFKCQFFEGVFSKKGVLKSPIESVHEENKPFKCQFCEEGFVSYRALESHKNQFMKTTLNTNR